MTVTCGTMRSFWRSCTAGIITDQMAVLLDKLRRRIDHKRKLASEKQELSGLYSPKATNFDLARHISEAMSWLKRAQDAGADRGVAYGTRFGDDFDASYPETTGYICQTFVEQAELTGDEDLLRRAIEMGDWEIAIQMPEGATMGGKLNTNPTPAVFNTGMVLLGWATLIRKTGEHRFRQAARRASDWLLSMQEPDGNWIRGNSHFANSGSTLYNVKAAFARPVLPWGRTASCRLRFATRSSALPGNRPMAGFPIVVFPTRNVRCCTQWLTPCRVW